MYTIKQAAARAGISVPLARAWERRYGVVHPARTRAGYRLYDDAAIRRLQAMRDMVDSGWSPSAAAANLATVADEALPATEPPAADAAPADDAGQFAERFVVASADLDSGLVERLLDEALARGSFEHVADRYLMPALDALGAAWESGRVDVAAEHAASNAVLRRLGAAYEAAARPGTDRRVVLVGMPPGARHELGALAFAVAARRAGLPVLYLGADLPLNDWIEAARRTRARAAVIGAVTAADADPARRVGRALRATDPLLLVAFGGRAAPASDGGAIRLPEPLASAVDALTSAMRGGQRRR